MSLQLYILPCCFLFVRLQINVASSCCTLNHNSISVASVIVRMENFFAVVLNMINNGKISRNNKILINNESLSVNNAGLPCFLEWQPSLRCC